jgi:hypothetical protein
VSRSLALLAVLGAAIAVGCDSGTASKSSGTATTTASASATVSDHGDSGDLRSHEQELRDTAPQFFRDLFTSGAVTTYDYFADDYKKKCALSDFAAAIAFVKVLYGQLAASDVQVTVTGVRYEGAKAFVDTKVSIKGNDLSSTDAGMTDYWVRQNGSWKIASDKSSPCSLTGTTSTGTSPDDQTPASGPGTSRAEAVSIGTAVRTGDIEVTVLSADLNASDRIAQHASFPATPETGNRFVLARVRLRAVGSGEATVQAGDSNFALTGSKNVVYTPYDQKARCGFSVPDEINAELFPGGIAEGNVCFQAPQDEQRLILIVEPSLGAGNADRRYVALQ